MAAPRTRTQTPLSVIAATALTVCALLLTLVAALGSTSAVAAGPGGERSGESGPSSAARVPAACRKFTGRKRKACVRRTERRKERCAQAGKRWSKGACRVRPNPPRVTRLTALEGGSGLTSANTIAAWQRSLARGVSGLHLPVRLSQDGQWVVSSTATVPSTCTSGLAATLGDPEFPYQGKAISALTVAQLRTLDCGARANVTAPMHDAPGARMPLLREVWPTLAHHRATGVDVDLEVAAVPAADRAQVAASLVAAVPATERARTRISSRDWAFLASVGSRPGIRRVGIGAPDDRSRGLARARRLGLSGWQAVVSRKRPMTMAHVRNARKRHLTVQVRLSGRAGGETQIRLGVDELLTARVDRVRHTMTKVREPLPARLRDPDAGRVLAQKRAHAHNDYVHQRPLLDALDEGFMSVEADVFLRNGTVFVAHDESGITAARTLDALYFKPLSQRVSAGSILGRGRPFHLLIDIKDDGLATYQAIEALMAQYPTLFTQFAPTRVDRPVSVTISGSSPVEHMQSQTVRLAGYDGRPGDLTGAGATWSPDFMPLVSESWLEPSVWGGTTWWGSTPISTTQQRALTDLVTRGHAQGRQVRIWFVVGGRTNTSPYVVLHDLGVDLLNADDLPMLAEFLDHRDPHFLR